jgi:hypothetical protein
MKTIMQARGFIGAVASLLGVFAVGCGADYGPEGAAGDEAEIGVSEQALSAPLTAGNNPVDKTDGTGGTTDIRKGWASSCVLTATVNNVTADYLIEAGGIDAGGSPIKQIVVYKKGSNPFVQPNAAGSRLTVASGSGQMVKLSATTCAYVGGADIDDSASATATANVDLLTLSFDVSNNPVITVTNKQSLGQARANFMMGVCTDSNNGKHLWALGGRAGATFRDTIEISNTALTSWASSTAMQVPRAVFGADIDPTDRGILAGGGKTTGGTRDNTVDVIRLDSNCAFVDTTASTQNLSASLDGNVIAYLSTADKFVSLAGTKVVSSVNTLATDERVFTVTFNTSPTAPSVSKTDVASPGYTGTYRPYPIIDDAGELYLVGGSNAAINASIDKVQERDHAATGTWDVETANAGIYGGVGGFLPTHGEIWALSGYSTAPSTIGTVVDAFAD